MLPAGHSAAAPDASPSSASAGAQRNTKTRERVTAKGRSQNTEHSRQSGSQHEHTLEHVSEMHLHVDSQHLPMASHGFTNTHLQRVAAIFARLNKIKILIRVGATILIYRFRLDSNRTGAST